jgi:hypothetical protein
MGGDVPNLFHVWYYPVAGTPTPPLRLARWALAARAGTPFHYGLPILFALVMVESFGIPVPGETALIAFGVLAAKGHYAILVVITVAAGAAIAGDNLGYWLIGCVGGRALFSRWRWLHQYSARVLPRAERVSTMPAARATSSTTSASPMAGRGGNDDEGCVGAGG